MVDLLDRVLGSAHRAEAVAARLEVRLEDRLEHQLEAGLHDTVARGRDAKTSQLARRLGDHPLAHRQRSEPAGLEIVSQLAQELLAVLGADGAWLDAIDPGRSCSSVAPHAIPADRQEGRIADEVEQVTEPTIGAVGRPSVQLGLDLAVPATAPRRGSATERRCSPTTSWHSSIRHCWLAGSLRHVDGFPDLGLLRSLRPAPAPSADSGPARRRPRRATGGRLRDGSHVHHVPIDGVGAQLFPCSIATSTPQTFLVASPPTALGRLRSRPPASRTACAALRPTSTRLEPASALEGVQPLVHLRYTFPSR